MQRLNARLNWQLKEHGHCVFLPRRDGFELATVDGSKSAPAPKSIRRKVFALDTSELPTAELVLANLDSRIPHKGVCVEIGIAWWTCAADANRSAPRIIELRIDGRGWQPGALLDLTASEALGCAVRRWAVAADVACLRMDDGEDASRPTD